MDIVDIFCLQYILRSLMNSVKSCTKNKMTGKLKKFDENLYNKYDIPARNKIKCKLGNLVDDNPDIYAEDMVLNMENCEYKYIELQVCTNWVEEKYPYSYPFVYERKAHFSPKTLFIILNRGMTRGLMFGIDFLRKTPRRLKKHSRYFVYDANSWWNIYQFNTDNFSEKTIKSYCGPFEIDDTDNEVEDEQEKID